MSISILTVPTISVATSLISGPTWAPVALDAFTATSLSGTTLPDTTCAGSVSPIHGKWLSPKDSVTLEPLNQTTLDYALACCNGAGIYYFIDPQCSDQVSSSGLFCQPVGQTLAQLDLCLKNGTKPANGIGGLFCNGNGGQCDQSASVRSDSMITFSATASDGGTSTSNSGSTATPAKSSSPPVTSQAAAPVLIPHGDGPAGTSKIVVALGVAWLVALFAGAVAM